MASRVMDAATGRLAFIALAIGMLALPVACSREGASDRARTASSASGTVTRADTSTPETLAGTHWRLVEMQSKPQTVRPNDPSRYTLAFDSEGGIVSMQLDCNRANGPYDDKHDSQRHEGTITIGPLAMTRAACPPPSISDRVARDLSSARSYRFANGRLYMQAPDGGVSVWERDTTSR